MPSVAVVATVALLASLVAAGCGGSSPPSRSDYQATVVSTRDRVDAALANIPRARSVEDFLERMIRAADAIERAADDLDDAGAAAGFDDETEQLVGALQQLSTDIEATAEQAQVPGYEGILAGKGLSWPSWDEVNATLGTLRKQGIRVEPVARH